VLIKSRRKRLARHVEITGYMTSAYVVLALKGERKRPLGRCRLRWEDNIKMDLKEIEWTDFD
jgi:hypothetical protein